MWALPRSAAHTMAHPAAVGHQSNPVSGIERHLGQTQRRVHGVIELAKAADASSHQAAGVDHDPDRLASLHLINAGDQLAPPRRRGPADVAILVAFAVFAQALEFAANAPHAGMAFFQLNLAAADQIHRLALGFIQIWVNLDLLLQRHPGPALGNPQRTLIAKVSIAKLRFSAFCRVNRVVLRRCASRGSADRNHRRLGTQFVGNTVQDVCVNHRIRFVGKLQVDLGLNRQSRWRAPAALEFQLRRLGQPSQIKPPEQEDETVPGQHGIGEARFDENRHKPHHPNRNQQKEAPAESDSPAFVGARHSHRRRWNQAFRSLHLGTSTARSTSCRTWSGVTPSRSASGFSTMRWRSTGLAACLTSSGIR